MSSLITSGREMLRAWGAYEKRAALIERHIDQMRQRANDRPSLRADLDRQIERHRVYLDEQAAKAEAVQGLLLRTCSDRNLKLCQLRYKDSLTWTAIGQRLCIDESYARRLDKSLAYYIATEMLHPDTD